MSDAKISHEPVIERRRELVFPNDANTIGTLFGGRALALMDITAALAAMRVAHKPVVTASIDRVDFKHPVYVGELADITARVTKIGRTSIHLEVELWAENLDTGERRLCTIGKIVMVALGPDGKPAPVRDEETKA